ncbi:MAG TPA: MFS transporter [Stellaceae bacterium]|nr:MFS transporter [Stellaceae bacterium]
MPERKRLLTDRRFLPYFLTQAIAAFNDNVFKNAVILLIVFSSAAPDLLVNLCAGAFILPFFFASATAGQVAERMPKARLIRWLKLSEVAIMALGAVALAWHAMAIAVVVLFLAGVQAAFFGPVKFSLLPQALRDDELVEANALIEMATFLAILLGTITGAVLVAGAGGPVRVGVVMVAIAVLGYLTSRAIPTLPPVMPSLRVDWNPLPEMLRLARLTVRERSVGIAIFGVSWFWLLGATYLTQLPSFTRGILGGDEHVVTLLLAVFSVGIGLGSLLCARWSRGRLEPGLVLIGALGISVFGGHLAIAQSAPWQGGTLRGAVAFVADPASWLVIADLVMIGAFGGLYVVPLQALVQLRTEPTFRSRIIAANNIWNALFLVGSAVLAGILLGPVGLRIPALFGVLAILNLMVAGALAGSLPEFVYRTKVLLGRGKSSSPFGGSGS